MDSLELMEKREEETARLVSMLSEKSRSFTEPKMVLIGGYALRVFVPFSRYSKDCDFALKEGLDIVKGWAVGAAVETFEKKDDHGFMRWVSVFDAGSKKAKSGIDFMEKQVRGREGEAFAIDDEFLSNSRKASISIAGNEFEFFVPSYTDFFILKVMAARESDARDIAALVWKNGMPDAKNRLASLNNPDVFTRNLKEKILPDIENKFFLNSWRGVFDVMEFTDREKGEVVDQLRGVI